MLIRNDCSGANDINLSWRPLFYFFLCNNNVNAA
ncbi:hypothetical protein M2107_001629 [Paenibacillus sp. PastM-2]|nr:hypothetical protein [Paenibacillus sp. PastM-2]